MVVKNEYDRYLDRTVDHLNGFVDELLVYDDQSETKPDASFLDKKYTCFGKLIKGEDVLDKIASTPCGPGGDGARSAPMERQGVESVKIVDRATIK
jgi:cyclophilin family peptidyl-prolyl cis-trans isomerase